MLSRRRKRETRHEGKKDQNFQGVAGSLVCWESGAMK